MKATPRIEMLEEIVCGGMKAISSKMERVRYWHNEISSKDYSEAITSMTDELKGTIDFLKELQKEVEK